jgi:hypothetical protein
VHIPYNSRGDKEVAEELAKLSFLKYGRPKAEVEEEIIGKYQM